MYVCGCVKVKFRQTFVVLQITVTGGGDVGHWGGCSFLFVRQLMIRRVWNPLDGGRFGVQRGTK